jgi:UDP-N-acetylglucosamine:LPS N-acetylglucosamine transferase
MLLEQDMTGPALLQALSRLLEDREKLAHMSTSARAFAHPRAAARIAELAAGLAGTGPP